VRSRVHWQSAGLAAGLALSVIGCGGSSPSPVTPTPTPPPALTISCPTNATGTSKQNQPVTVTWTAPTTTGGQAPVTTNCSPESGSGFPVGTTNVTCRASDTASQVVTCGFSVTIAAAPQLSVTKFMAFGDSITQGVDSPPAFSGIWDPAAWPKGYPFKLNDLLKAQYSDQTLTVLNDGFYGEEIADGLARLPSEVRYYQPDVLMLLEGANDLLFTPSESTTTYIVSRLEDMIRTARLQKSNIIILLATFPPQYQGTDPYDRGAGRFWVPTLNGKIATLAVTSGVTLVDLYKDFTATGTRLIGVDGLHPTDAGYTQMAKSFYTAISTTLEKKKVTVQPLR
jgi:lysophospholipase L1-like esterase